MSWLSKIIGSVLSNMLSKIAVKVFKFFDTYFKMSKRQKELNSMATDVEKISEEIKALLKDGKEVPNELKDKLREASKKLINSSSIK